MYRSNGQFDDAIAEAKHAVKLDGNNPEGYLALAASQIRSGQMDDGLRNLRTADRLDPGNLRPNWYEYGLANLFLGHHDEATRYLELSVSAKPNYHWTYRYLIAAYGHLGKTAEAKAAIKKMNQLRVTDGFRPLTVTEAAGLLILKREVDKQTLLQGLRKAGLPTGADPGPVKQSPDSLISRADSGHFEVHGATKVTAKDVKALLDQGAAVFEMRHSRHWEAGHPAGALFAQKVVGDFTAANLEKVVKKDQVVAFYCGGFT
jgi:tetratricopeptide (TPR) repeat protein